MKKRLSLVLALGLACSTVLAGCGGGNSETQPQTIAAPTTEAVSYTHLDVYKRQELRRRK